MQRLVIQRSWLVFCKCLGWSQRRFRDFAKVGKDFELKQKVIEGRAPAPLGFDDLGIDHMVQITKTNA